ncbi:MAG: hypothetical protein Ct9H300mP19_06830 [Dehalococcoidia bacterium]|nr:MAG: hypothetical protein Ct9H300mP19_06830 [Dehalococcoidia bacterium]
MIQVSWSLTFQTPSMVEYGKSQFTAQTSRELRQGVQKLIDNGAEGIILDLRGNPVDFCLQS